MVIVKLQGGLGNQMFQYAAARSVIKSVDSTVICDHTFLETHAEDSLNFTARQYELNIFKKCKARKAKFWQLKLIFDHCLFFRVIRGIFNLKIKYVRQHGDRYTSIPLRQHNELLYLDGYFQSGKYFSEYREAILQEFEFPILDFKNESLKKIITNTTNAISLHVRRGDYIKSAQVLNKHGILPATYYQKALGLFKEKIGQFTLFIFSDDIEWAKTNIEMPGNQLLFIDHNNGADSWKDMALMSCCQHHIIANSSFSWWGAWLSVQNGMVYAPERWFNPAEVDFEISDIVPSEWQILNYD